MVKSPLPSVPGFSVYASAARPLWTARPTIPTAATEAQTDERNLDFSMNKDLEHLGEDSSGKWFRVRQGAHPRFLQVAPQGDSDWVLGARLWRSPAAASPNSPNASDNSIHACLALPNPLRLVLRTQSRSVEESERNSVTAQGLQESQKRPSAGNHRVAAPEAARD